MNLLAVLFLIHTFPAMAAVPEASLDLEQRQLWGSFVPIQRIEGSRGEQYPHHTALIPFPVGYRLDAPVPMPEDVFALVRGLGDASYRVRYLSQRDLIRALRFIIDKNHTRFPVALAEVRRLLRSQMRTAGAASLEVLRRLQSVAREVETYAPTRYHCRCVVRCRNGNETGEFETALLSSDACGIDHYRYHRFYSNCYDPSNPDSDGLSTASASCRVVSGPAPDIQPD